MCIAIMKPRGKTIDKETLRTCFENNPDGAGFTYSRDGKLRVFKTMDSFKKWWKEYQKQDPDKYDMALHFRITSAGPTNYTNAHPHNVGPDIAIIHNGTLKIDHKKHESDTLTFARDILSYLPRGWMKNPGIHSLIETALGTSKMVAFNKTGLFHIYNEHLGHWVEGSWFSNHSYQELTFEDDYTFYSYQTKKSHYPATDNYPVCDMCQLELITKEEKEIGLCETCNHDEVVWQSMIEEEERTRKLQEVE